MGFLRTFLALSVVFVHAGPLFGVRGIGGDVAVQTFFMISGFYMTLILSNKYVGPGSLQQFIWNRFLRLFPIYWIVALMTLAYFLVTAAHPFDCRGVSTSANCFVAYDFFERYSRLDVGALTYLAASNLTLFGQDAALFLTLNEAESHLRFTTDFMHAGRPVYPLLLVPQGWSLSVELGFYLIAPWLVRRSVGVMLVVLIASLALRCAIYEVIGAHDPWTYRFFPTELALFSLGILSCKAYLRHVREMPMLLPFVVAALFLAVSVAYQWWRLPGAQWTYYALAALSLPFLFRATKDWSIDSRVGDLSYPIYTVHILVITVIVPLAAGTAWEMRLSWIAVPATLLAAVLLWLLVGKPVENFRHSGLGGPSSGLARPQEP